MPGKRPMERVSSQEGLLGPYSQAPMNQNESLGSLASMPIPDKTLTKKFLSKTDKRV